MVTGLPRFAGWLPAGCRLVAGWLPAGCRLAAGWLLTGCRLAAGRPVAREARTNRLCNYLISATLPVMSFSIYISVFMVNARKQILLLKEAGKENYGKYKLPGSKLRPNEPLLECAKRAVTESIGITAGIEALLGIYTVYGEEHSLHLIFFSSYLYGQITPNQNQVIATHWAEEKEMLLMADYEMADPKKMRKALNDYRRGNRLPLELITENVS